jgi:hypothetical protein
MTRCQQAAERKRCDGGLYGRQAHGEGVRERAFGWEASSGSKVAEQDPPAELVGHVQSDRHLRSRLKGESAAPRPPRTVQVTCTVARGGLPEDARRLIEEAGVSQGIFVRAVRSVDGAGVGQEAPAGGRANPASSE